LPNGAKKILGKRILAVLKSEGDYEVICVWLHKNKIKSGESWIFVNAYPVKTGKTQIYHFGFKKLFSKSEVSQN